MIYAGSLRAHVGLREIVQLLIEIGSLGEKRGCKLRVFGFPCEPQKAGSLPDKVVLRRHGDAR